MSRNFSRQLWQIRHWTTNLIGRPASRYISTSCAVPASRLVVKRNRRRTPRRPTWAGAEQRTRPSAATVRFGRTVAEQVQQVIAGGVDRCLYRRNLHDDFHDLSHIDEGPTRMDGRPFALFNKDLPR